jgi:hypothetical protein
MLAESGSTYTPIQYTVMVIVSSVATFQLSELMRSVGNAIRYLLTLRLNLVDILIDRAKVILY